MQQNIRKEKEGGGEERDSVLMAKDENRFFFRIKYRLTLHSDHFRFNR